MCPIGGSRKMATKPASNSTNGITAPIGATDRPVSSSAQASISYSEHSTPTLSLFGDALLMTPSQSSTASTAPCSETRGRSSRRSLSDRLMPLLISRGLVRGITPMSMRVRFGQRTPAFAFLQQAGGDAVEPKAACSFSNDYPTALAADNADEAVCISNKSPRERGCSNTPPSDK